MSGAGQHPAARHSPRALVPAGATAAIEGLYVHVPFCFHKCHYCDFYSITRQSTQRMERFVDLMLQEARGWIGDGAPATAIRTIFFGGGTPSLLPQEAMERLLRGLAHTFDLGAVDEWTVEVNPATADLAYCRMMRQLGVNRLSFGAQSFNTDELKRLERHHDPADVPRSVEIARSAGFARVNLDLIYAIPGQDLPSWLHSLEQAIALRTEHLSCYGLTYESNTPMAVRKRLGTIRAVDEDEELRMLHATRQRLSAAGYHAYEISNYAITGEECRHNLVYWNGGNYLGLGPSAASHIDGQRWRNRGHLGEWEKAVEANLLPTADIEQLSPQQRAGELAMLQLRLAGGIDFGRISALTGFAPEREWEGLLQRLVTLGLVTASAAGVQLTSRGLNVADAVAAEFLAQ